MRRHRAGPGRRHGHRRHHRRRGGSLPLLPGHGRRQDRRGPCRTAQAGTACSSGSAGDRRDAGRRRRHRGGRNRRALAPPGRGPASAPGRPGASVRLAGTTRLAGNGALGPGRRRRAHAGRGRAERVVTRPRAGTRITGARGTRAGCAGTGCAGAARSRTCAARPDVHPGLPWPPGRARRARRRTAGASAGPGLTGSRSGPRARGSPRGWPASAAVRAPAARCPGCGNRRGRDGTRETPGPAAAGARRRRRAPQCRPSLRRFPSLRRLAWLRPESWGWPRRARPRPPGPRRGRSRPPRRLPRWPALRPGLRPARPWAQARCPAPQRPGGRRCGMTRRRIAAVRRLLRHEARTGPLAWTCCLLILLARRRGKRLLEPPDHGRLYRRGRRPYELAHFLELVHYGLALDPELLREFVNPDLRHYAPSRPVPWTPYRTPARAERAPGGPQPMVIIAACSSSAHQLLDLLSDRCSFLR